ncbi:hypothetical protein DFH09DRAFT_200196 [Mycena vulgaris]|nr:hypothetical protein DFH09DRAFT_200196 [Mycena vulgaris]
MRSRRRHGMDLPEPARTPPGPSPYNSSTPLTFIGSEARNENIYRIHICIVNAELAAIGQTFALQIAKQRLSRAQRRRATAPCVVTNPVGYTVTNLRLFDVPVASAVTSVGLIYLLILSFFIVMRTSGARLAAGYETMLALRSLICVRLLTSFITYFWIVLFYTFLSRAFQLPFDCKLGRAGLVVF